MTPLVRSARGFSLIEMVITVGIIGVIAAMAVPNMTKWVRANDFENDKTSVRDALLRARSMAASRKECVKVTISSSTTIDVDSHTADPAYLCPDPLDTVTTTLPTFTVSSTSSIGQFAVGAVNSSTLVFLPTGAVRSTGIAKLVVTSNNGSGKLATYTIYPAIGQIRVQ